MGDISTASVLDKKVKVISQLLSKLNDFTIDSKIIDGLKDELQHFDEVLNDKERRGLKSDRDDIRVRRQSRSE